MATCAAIGAALTVAPPAAAAESPPTLRGAWAPLNRCPVDDPAMLAADGAVVAAICLASSSANGSITLGNTTATTEATDLQFGLLSSGGRFTIVPPPGGAILAAPVRIPGGLLGLMCPSDIPFVSSICRLLIDNNPLNVITATVEPAGNPSDFNLFAGVGIGVPILTLPVKIHLENPFLGPDCFIGSNATPIVLRPRNVSAPTAASVRFDPDGTLNPAGEMGYLSVTGASQGDDTFAVPAADGCGLTGLLDAAINLRSGLPSPAGANSLVLNNATTAFGGFFTPSAFVPTEGRQLADRWHAAVVS